MATFCEGQCLGGCSMVSSSRCGKGARLCGRGRKLQDQLLIPISPPAFSPKKKSVTVVLCYISYSFVFCKILPPKKRQYHSISFTVITQKAQSPRPAKSKLFHLVAIFLQPCWAMVTKTRCRGLRSTWSVNHVYSLKMIEANLRNTPSLYPRCSGVILLIFVVFCKLPRSTVESYSSQLYHVESMRRLVDVSLQHPAAKDPFSATWATRAQGRREFIAHFLVQCFGIEIIESNTVSNGYRKLERYDDYRQL